MQLICRRTRIRIPVCPLPMLLKVHFSHHRILNPICWNSQSTFCLCLWPYWNSPASTIPSSACQSHKMAHKRENPVGTDHFQSLLRPHSREISSFLQGVTGISAVGIQGDTWVMADSRTWLCCQSCEAGQSRNSLFLLPHDWVSTGVTRWLHLTMMVGLWP